MNRADRAPSKPARSRATAGKPPRRLPPGFLEIWQAIDQANREAPSRQVLARRLGISTGTIQRILVRGDVPRFGPRTSTRVVRSWVRTLSRLAGYFGADPRAWVESAGIRWDEAAARAAAAKPHGRAGTAGSGAGMATDSGTASGAASGSASAAAAPGSMALPEQRIIASGAQGPGSPEGAQSAWPVEAIAHGPFDPVPDPVRVGILPSGSLTGPLPRKRGSFLEIYTARLVNAIRPGVRCAFRPADVGSVVEELLAGDLDLAAGIPGTLEHRARGLSLLELPGPAVRLSAFGLRHALDPLPLPSWTGLLSGPEDAALVVVASGEPVAAAYLRARRDELAGTLSEAPAADPELLAAFLLDEMEGAPSRRAVLVGTEELCREVAQALEEDQARTRQIAAGFLEGAPACCPVYPLAIAWSASAGSWARLLEPARDLDLMGIATEDTGALYAEWLAADLRLAVQLQPAYPERVRPEPAWIWPASLPDAFRKALVAGLEDALERELLPSLRARGESGNGDVLRALARRLAGRHARRFLPVEWFHGPGFGGPESGEPEAAARRAEAFGAEMHPEAAPGAGDLEPALAAAPHCQSCSVSLLDGHNRGVSDRFCRFCADDSGRLKPRDEVRRLIAGWMRGWQEVEPDEALRRAGLLMRAQPAWSQN